MQKFPLYPLENTNNITSKNQNENINENNINNNSSENSQKLVNFSLCCITWNMHGEAPSNKQIKDLLDPHKQKNFDIIAIGSEECLRSIFKSLFYWDKTQWETQLIEYFGNDYTYFDSYTLAAMHLIIFVKTNIKNNIKFIGKNYVKTGGYNLLGNKGAVGIWFQYYNLKIMIMNAHLAANKVFSQKRNDDFKRVINNMNENNKQIDFIIFMGDLNYRLNTSLFDMRNLRRDYKKYLVYDQLYCEKNLRRLDATGFREGEINFLPTFKYFNGTDEFDATNPNKEPAWTDRILFYKKDTIINVFDVQLKEYNSMQHINMSDHKPVYGYFDFIVKIND